MLFYECSKINIELQLFEGSLGSSNYRAGPVLEGGGSISEDNFK